MRTRKRRRWSRLSLLYFLVTLGLLVGGSLWLDHRSDTVPATVSGKQEEIRLSFAPQGAWYRFYRVGVSFTTADQQAGAATIGMPRERFDALEPGDTLPIRYLAALPLLARAADRSTATVVRELGQRVMADQELAPPLLWFGAGFLLLWIGSRVATGAVFGIGLVWLAAGYRLLFPAPPPVSLSSAEGLARVEAISLVDRAPERRGTRRVRLRRSPDTFMRLKVPYQVVQLKVPVPGRPDSALAVDAVDSGSTPGLAFGALLRVRVDPAAPREARLAEGTREFMVRNRYHYLVPILGAGGLLILGAWGWRARREP